MKKANRNYKLKINSEPYTQIRCYELRYTIAQRFTSRGSFFPFENRKHDDKDNNDDNEQKKAVATAVAAAAI